MVSYKFLTEMTHHSANIDAKRFRTNEEVDR